MHVQFSDTFTGITFGAAERHVFRVDPAGGGSTPTTTPSSTPTSADTAERDAETAAAKNAAKDGRITTDAERGAVTTQKGKETVAAEQARLGSELRNSNSISRTEYRRSDDGQLEVDDDGNAQEVVRYGGRQPESEHLDRVDDLKDRPTIEEIRESRERLQDAGVESGVGELQAAEDARIADEAAVVDVIRDKTALRGNLEAERVAIEESLPETAQNDYQALREQALPLAREFMMNGGKFREGNDFAGDDWDDIDLSRDYREAVENGDTARADELAGRFFDHMIEYYHGEERYKTEWASHQGHGNDGRSDAEMREHIADLAGDDPNEAARVATRYEAAQDLANVFDQYVQDREIVEANDGRIAEIDAEIGILDESIANDREALSQVTITALDAELSEAAGVEEAPAEDATTTAPQQDGETSGTGDSGGTGDTPPPVEGEDAGSTDGGGATDGPENTDGRPDSSNTDNGNPPTGSDTDTTGADPGSTDSTDGTDSTGNTGAPAMETIDYNSPEERPAVLQAAQEQGYLPADASFNDGGEAVITVTRENGARGYWGIAEQTAGPGGVTADHWRSVWNSNAERLGRNTSPEASQFIGVGDQLVIPGRSINDLIALLSLPAEREVEEEQPAGGGGGGGVHYR